MDDKLKQKAIKKIKTVRALNGAEIPFLSGRPLKSIPIKRDDIINFKILLNTTNWDEFLLNC